VQGIAKRVKSVQIGWHTRLAIMTQLLKWQGLQKTALVKSANRVRPIEVLHPRALPPFWSTPRTYRPDFPICQEVLAQVEISHECTGNWQIGMLPDLSRLEPDSRSRRREQARRSCQLAAGPALGPTPAESRTTRGALSLDEREVMRQDSRAESWTSSTSERSTRRPRFRITRNPRPSASRRNPSSKSSVSFTSRGDELLRSFDARERQELW